MGCPKTDYQEAASKLLGRLRDGERTNPNPRLDRGAGYRLAENVIEQLDDVDITTVMLALAVVLAVVEEASPKTRSGITASDLLKNGLNAYQNLLNAEDAPLVQ